MKLRAYRPADFPTLYRIDQSCFPPGISYSREELAQFIAHGESRTWVAEEGGAIAGFLIAGREPGGVGHFITVDVAAEWRRRGVGRMLMDAAEKWARRQGLKMLYLETAEDNVAAQAFYEALGYAKYEKINNYYPGGRSAWILMKLLKPSPSPKSA